MAERRGLIVAIIVVILILSLLGGMIYFLTGRLGIRQRLFGSQNPVPSIQNEASPSVGTLGATNSGDNVYQANGFQLIIPQNWGVLVCNNSSNFEFDPYTPGRISTVCTSAQKEVTVLVNSNFHCQGDKVNIGPYQVLKFRRDAVVSNTGERVTEYNWCFSAKGKNFSISHRVSPTGGLATSTDDLSSQIEAIIASIR